jgi:hypothetical protein
VDPAAAIDRTQRDHGAHVVGARGEVIAAHTARRREEDRREQAAIDGR